MARIRTIKPELFRHEDLFNLEQSTGLPIRLAWAGLFCVSDREGRFKWRPKELKLDVMPYDKIDFSAVLDALESGGFIVRYAVNGDIYGHIPSFRRHQVINHRESPSKLPEPNKNNVLPTRQVQCPGLPGFARGELEGKGTGRELELEGNWKGTGTGVAGESKRKTQKTLVLAKANPDPKESLSPTVLVWQSYAKAYTMRHGQEPVRNARVNGQLAQFVKRVPADEAPEIAKFYVWHNRAFYVQKSHPVGLMLADAETLRTEWLNGKQITGTEARAMENRQQIVNAFGALLEKELEKENANANTNAS